MVQWLGLSVFTTVGPSSIPGKLRYHKPHGAAKKKNKWLKQKCAEVCAEVRMKDCITLKRLPGSFNVYFQWL